MIFQAQYEANGREYPLLDCMGFLIYMFKTQQNKDIIDFDYKDPNNPENEKYYHEGLNGNHWKPSAPKKGCAVALRVNGYISHVGYMVNDKEFIHIMKETGVVKVKIKSPKWAKRILGFYTYD